MKERWDLSGQLRDTEEASRRLLLSTITFEDNRLESLEDRRTSEGVEAHIRLVVSVTLKFHASQHEVKRESFPDSTSFCYVLMLTYAFSNRLHFLIIKSYDSLSKLICKTLIDLIIVPSNPTLNILS